MLCFQGGWCNQYKIWKQPRVGSFFASCANKIKKTCKNIHFGRNLLLEHMCLKFKKKYEFKTK